MPACLQGYAAGGPQTPYTLRHLDRYLPSTPYPQIVEALLALLREQSLDGAIVGGDRNGVGEPIMRPVYYRVKTAA